MREIRTNEDMMNGRRPLKLRAYVTTLQICLLLCLLLLYRLVDVSGGFLCL